MDRLPSVRAADRYDDMKGVQPVFMMDDAKDVKKNTERELFRG